MDHYQILENRNSSKKMVKSERKVMVQTSRWWMNKYRKNILPYKKVIWELEGWKIDAVWGLAGKESTFSVGDSSCISGSERSPLEGNGNPLQYSCLENPMERGAWQATVHRVAKNQTQLKQCSMHVPWKSLFYPLFRRWFFKLYSLKFSNTPKTERIVIMNPHDLF